MQNSNNFSIDSKIFILATFLFWLFLFAVLFFGTFSQSYLFSSPDEVANLYFTIKISEGDTIIPFPEDVPQNLKEYLRPRSVSYSQSLDGLKLSSFLGLPLIYSLFSKVFPPFVLLIIAPLIGVVALSIITNHFKFNLYIKLLLFSLLIFNPFFIYYSLRGFMHNVLFFNLLFLSVTLLVTKIDAKRTIPIILSASFFALAIATRTSEFLWSFFVVLFIFLLSAFKQKIKNSLKQFVVFLITFIILLSPFVYFSSISSQSLVQYRTLNSETLQSTTSLIELVKHYILPFGFSPKKSFSIFFSFIINIWWLTCTSILISVLAIFKFRKKIKKSYIIFFLFIAVYLVLIYGPYPKESAEDSVSIANSHYRYWLPLFILLPFSLALIPKIVKKGAFQKWSSLSLMIVYAVSSVFYVLNTEGGLRDMTYQNYFSKSRKMQILKEVPVNGIILAGRADKFFYPERIVAGTIVHEKRKDFVTSIKSASISTPVYYYHVEADISSHFTKEALEDAGVNFEYVAKFFDGGNAWEYLYKLDWPNKENNGNE